MTHVGLVTESLQCGVVTLNFCSLTFVTNFAYFQILRCVWLSSLNIVLVTRKGRLWSQIITTKSISKSTGKSILDIFLQKYRYRWWFHQKVSLLISAITFASIVNKPGFQRYAVAHPSVVCNICAPYSAGWNFRQCLYAVWFLGRPLPPTENFTEIFQGNPSIEGV